MRHEAVVVVRRHVDGAAGEPFHRADARARELRHLHSLLHMAVIERRVHVQGDKPHLVVTQLHAHSARQLGHASPCHLKLAREQRADILGERVAEPSALAHARHGEGKVVGKRQQHLGIRLAEGVAHVLVDPLGHVEHEVDAALGEEALAAGRRVPTYLEPTAGEQVVRIAATAGSLRQQVALRLHGPSEILHALARLAPEADAASDHQVLARIVHVEREQCVVVERFGDAVHAAVSLSEALVNSLSRAMRRPHRHPQAAASRPRSAPGCRRAMPFVTPRRYRRRAGRLPGSRDRTQADGPCGDRPCR